MTKPSTRTYNSDLRREQAERTQDSILAAFAHQLGRPEASDLSVPEAAVAAGVSLRTVYHYFPDREARLRGLAQWLEQRIQSVAFEPRTADDLPELVRIVNENAIINEALTRAQYATGFTSEVRAIRRARRVANIRKVIEEIGAPSEQTKLAAALVAHLISAEAALPLIDVYGLSYEETSLAVQAGVAAIVADLKRQAAQVAHPPSNNNAS